ncbi:MAG TPA: hypothetical protein VLL08_12685 [Kineosporiaceae bacterium]|nr:hypothetical protein [Kineosporiaceae bacterium]
MGTDLVAALADAPQGHPVRAAGGLAAAALLVLALTSCSGGGTPKSDPAPAPADSVELCAEEAYGAGITNMGSATPKTLLIKDLESCDDLPKAQQDQARDIMRGRVARDLLGAAGGATATPTP